jgi:hypothetical protein
MGRRASPQSGQIVHHNRQQRLGAGPEKFETWTGRNAEILASALVQGDIRYASLAVEHGAKLLGLMIQVDATDIPARSDLDAQEAIRKA